jgi:ABC-type multidrug transport system fused ATPase/permease subunit
MMLIIPNTLPCNSQEDATLVYGTNKADEFQLRVKHFDAFPGEVVAVVGRVGCGKSSLFNAILGNMVTKSGTVKVGGKIAYVPQTPWVQNLTLKDNILFGLPFDEDRYKKVVHACALELDFSILPKGACIHHPLAGRGSNQADNCRQFASDYGISTFGACI